MNRPRALALVVCSLVWTTPLFGATLTVNAGGNLQAAIDAAQPGDTIVLQAGATFTGPFTLRAKNGTAYITIRSSTADSQLPPPGTRITPAHAPLLAKIRPGATGSAIRTVPGASYWRLQFLEFLPSSSTSGSTLIELGSAGPLNQSSLSQVPHHFVVDRSYVHGNPSYGYQRGLALNSSHTEVRDSHFSDFKGTGYDTQAICGWNGPGPYLIENNHLEASGENVMFGGGDPEIANLVPSNITIRRNLFTKPTAWKTQNWTLINLLELKNAQNVVIEGNIFENNWVAKHQGYAIAVHAAQPGRHRAVDGGAKHHLPEQRRAARRRSLQHQRLRRPPSEPPDREHPHPQQPGVRHQHTAHHEELHAAPARFLLVGAGPKNHHDPPQHRRQRRLRDDPFLQRTSRPPDI